MPKLSLAASNALHVAAAFLLALAVNCFAGPMLHGQSKGTPGKFDFYVLDLPWGPEFCSIKDVSSACKPQRGFVVHGLWPQFNDGTWPVFCSDEHGPADLRPNLDITPDLQLLQHEWDKHGTCSGAGPRSFFQWEHQAFRSVAIPGEFRSAREEQAFTPEWIAKSFEFENPSFPAGSFAVSCKDERLAAVEVCFSKDLHPVACQGIQSCKAQVLRVEAAR